MTRIRLILCCLALLAARSASAQNVACCSRCDGTTQFLYPANGAVCPDGTPAVTVSVDKCGTAAAPLAIKNSPKCAQQESKCCVKCNVNCQQKTIAVQTHAVNPNGKCPAAFEGPMGMKTCNENSAPMPKEWDKALKACAENPKLRGTECCKKLLECH